MKNYIFGPTLVWIAFIICIDASSNNICTNSQECCSQTLRHADVCRNAETHCSNWANKIQGLSQPIADSLLRDSPWNASCSHQEHFCPLTSQCVSKTEGCRLNTTYKGSCHGNNSNPWGGVCSGSDTYCPLLARCIPSNSTCSLEALGAYLQNGAGYYGQNCASGEQFCPGTQTCIQNTTSCSFNESLSILNITCPGNSTFCIGERRCTNQACNNVPSYPQYSLNDTKTGWKLFCDNFKYICPKILSVEEKCKTVKNANSGCRSKCGYTPEVNCYCPAGQYKCDLNAGCTNNTIQCAEPAASSVCSVQATLVHQSATPSSNASIAATPNGNVSIAATPNGNVSIAATPNGNVSIAATPNGNVSIAATPNGNVSIAATPNANATIAATPSSAYVGHLATPVAASCNYICRTGFSYCQAASACVVDGYDCSGSAPFCSKDYKWCSSSGQCITKQSSCVSASTSVPLQTPAPPGNASSVAPQANASQHVPSQVVPSASVNGSQAPPSVVGQVSPTAAPASHASQAPSVASHVSPSQAPASSAAPQPASSPASVQASLRASQAPSVASHVSPSQVPASSAAPQSASHQASVQPSSRASQAPSVASHVSLSQAPASSAAPQSASHQASVQPSSRASQAASTVVQASPSAAPRSSVSPQNRSVAPQPSSSQAAAHNRTTQVSPSPAATKAPVAFNSSAAQPQRSQSQVVAKNTTIAPQTVLSITPTAAKSSVTISSSVAVTPPLAAPKAEYAIAQWGAYKSYANTLQQAEPAIRSPQKIAIASLPATPASWLVYYGGAWHPVSNLNSTSAVVLSPGDKLGVQPTSGSFHGSLLLLAANVSSKLASGARTSTSGIQTFYISVLYLPKHQVPNLEVVNLLRNVTEDSTGCSEQFRLRDAVNVTVTRLTSNLDNITRQIQASSQLVKQYVAKVAAVNQCKPYVELVGISLENTEVFYSEQPGKRTKYSFGSKVLPLNATICIKPQANRNGAGGFIRVKARQECGNANTGSSSGQESLVITITAANDQPKCIGNDIRLKDIAKDSMPDSNGFIVSSVTGVSANGMSDVDQQPLGLAVIYGKSSSSIGRFEYSIDNGTSWSNISLVQDIASLSSKAVQAVLLRNTDKIRFVLYNSASAWSLDTAKADLFLLVFAWDMSDGKSAGPSTFNVTAKLYKTCKHFPSSICCRQTRLLQMKISGCDNIAGSTASIDACDKCEPILARFNKSCLGCDNVPKSGAIIDNCQICTNGTTGKTPNYLVDCNGQCNTSFTDECGNCQSKTNFVNFTDCAGVCNGLATLNECGNCAGGTTGKDVNFGKDPCLVCGGNGSSCADCSGTANGGKQIDVCGHCLLPNDTLFNSQCTKIGIITPVVLPNNTQHYLRIPGAGLSKYNALSCTFVLGATKIAAANSTFLTGNTGVQVQSPAALSAGQYKIECTFSSSSPGIAASTQKTPNTVNFYYKGSITQTSVAPTESSISAAFEAIVTGSGFFNSPQLKCVTHNGLKLTATYISSTSIRCSVPATKPSIKLAMTISFSAADRNFDKSNNVTVDIYAYNANITTARFQSRNLGNIILTLDKASRNVPSKTTCSDFFTDVTKLGTNPKCTFKKTTEFVIGLGRNPTLLPNDKLIFTSTSIRCSRGDLTKYTISTQEITILGPSDSSFSNPKAVLITSPEVGSCADVELCGRMSRGNGRPLKFYWKAEVDPSYTTALSAAQTKAISDYNATLASSTNTTQNPSLQANSSLFNIPVKFTMTVENFLGLRDTMSKSVKRVNKMLPTLNAGAPSRNQKVSQNLVLEVNAFFQSKCLSGANAPSLKYEWSNQDGVTISLKNTRRLFIRKGTLTGGSTYKFTVTVTLADDIFSSVKTSLRVTMIAAPLIPILIVPSEIGFQDGLQVNPSKSRDPDKTSESEKCFIQFFDNRNKAVVYRSVGKWTRFSLSGCSRGFNVVTKDLFKSGTTYTVKLTYSKGARKATISKTFTVKSVSPPVIKIEPPDVEKIITTDNLILKSSVTVNQGSLTYKWSCSDCGDFDITAAGVALTPIEKTANVKQRRGSVKSTLVIKANTMPQGATLTFVLTATQGDISASASSEIVTNAAPKNGLFTMSPSSGNATQEIFTFSAEGYSDDAEDYPLLYSYGFVSKEKDGTSSDFYLQEKVSSSELKQQQFPEGDKTDSYKLKAFMIVEDAYGAQHREEKEITVNPVVISDSELANIAAAATADLSGNPLGASTKVGILFKSKAGGSDSGPSDSEIETRKNYVNQIGSVTGSLQTDEGKLKVAGVVFISLSSMDSSNTDSGTVASMANTMLALSGAAPPSSRRRRRSLLTTTVTTITTSQVETFLAPFHTLDAKLNDTSTQSAKANVITMSTDFLKKMCRSTSFNLAPSIAKATVVVLQSYKVDFSTNNNTEVKLGCSDCPQNIKDASYLQLGQSLIDSYSNYICNPNDDNCTGACIGTAQLPNDILSPTYITNRLSPVLLVKFWNPDNTYAVNELSATGLASPMLVRLPLQKTTNDTYECRLWNAASSSYVTAGASTVSQTPTTVGNTSFITCAISQTGYVTILEAPPIPTTTAAPTTTVATTTAANVTVASNVSSTVASNVSSNATTQASPTATTTQAVDTRPKIQVQFSFAVNCSTAYNASTKSLFEAAVKTSIANKLNISTSSIEGLQARCGSIVISFTFVGQSSNTSLASVNTTVQALKALVQSGTLVITTHDGKNLTADASSFTFTVVVITTASPVTTQKPTTTGATTKAPVVVPPKETGLSGGAIAGIVIGVILGVVLIAVLAYVLIFRKKTKQDSKVDPNSNAVEMQNQGSANPGYNESL